MTDSHDPEIVKKFMSQMKQAQESRGLERDAVPPCAKLVQAHYKTVFETQKKLRQKQLIGSTRGTDTLARACEKSSKAFALLACRIAQHDVREAMRAAFTFADAGVMIKGKENRMQRRNSVSAVRKSAKLTMTAVNRRNSLTSSSTRGDNSAPDRRNVMAKRAGGLDRRKMLGHSVSMRSINNKYGSLGL